MFKKTNNYRRTLRLKQDKPPHKILFTFIKLALLIVRLTCKLIEIFGGDTSDG